MSELYDQLHTAGSDSERRAITNQLIDTMRTQPNDRAANEAYLGLCSKVIDRLGHTSVHMSSAYAGEFSPRASASLVFNSERVSGFLGAIHNLGKIGSAVEAGPGSSAILSVGAARAGAQVVAYEINPQAAECAREVVGLTGYANQIEIVTGDILNADLPHADAAIAEILGPGLRGENGPAVIARLRNSATHVVPDGATLYATDTRGDSWAWDQDWHKVADVDLTNPAARVSGRFESVDSGLRKVMVRADIRSQGRTILSGVDADDITMPVQIGDPVTVPYPGAVVEFAYDIGPLPPTRPDYINVQG